MRYFTFGVIFDIDGPVCLWIDIKYRRLPQNIIHMKKKT